MITENRRAALQEIAEEIQANMTVCLSTMKTLVDQWQVLLAQVTGVANVLRDDGDPK